MSPQHWITLHPIDPKVQNGGFWVYGTSGYRGYTEWRVEIQREKEGAWGRGHFWNPNGRVWVWGYWFCLLVLRWPSTLFYSSYNPQIILFIMITTHTSLFLSLQFSLLIPLEERRESRGDKREKRGESWGETHKRLRL